MRFNFQGEDGEQAFVVAWASLNENKYPELKWLYHCPNGGKRNAFEAAKFKQLGVKPGVSDLFLPVPNNDYHGLFIEMKYGNNKLQDSQVEFLNDMEKLGYFVVTCYSGEIATRVIEDYLKNTLDIANNSVLKKEQ